ncbi:MAG: redoxin domain-containing protein [Acidobacteria bacterium]|nr:redoxin domain-containing protein [Acidobacteriota bacterium]
MELGEKRAAFAREGLGVAAMTYDSQAILKSFSDRKGVTYPLLTDPDSKVIRAFGILNEGMPKGTPYYGVPHPGTYIVDANGVVKRKFFETDYKERYTAGSILFQVSPEAAKQGWQEAKTNHLTLRWRTTDDKAHAGSRTTLVLEVALAKNMHVYAPGVQEGYIPVKWTLGSEAIVKSDDVRWPRSKVLDLKAIKEKAPVYEGRFTVEQDVTFAQQKPLQSAVRDGRLEFEGSFKYQACDQKECYPPVTVPLKWTVGFETLDSTRVPDELRRK